VRINLIADDGVEHDQMVAHHPDDRASF